MTYSTLPHLSSFRTETTSSHHAQTSSSRVTSLVSLATGLKRRVFSLPTPVLSAGLVIYACATTILVGLLSADNAIATLGIVGLVISLWGVLAYLTFSTIRRENTRSDEEEYIIC